MAVGDPNYQDAISGIESGGNYGILGPTTKSGDRAYGKYQVMGANIPGWTKQYYGQQLTPEQFLNNPQAQDAVFNGQFGAYVQKYGPEGAARAWFGGPGNVNNPNAVDQLGTSVQQYGQKFMAGLGGPPLTGPLPAQGQTPGAPSQTLAASQQPSTPIQSPQGAPQSMVTAPNSGLTGFAPPSGPVLGMGGNGGGQFYSLGTQSPSPGPGESPLAAGPLAGKQVSPQQIYNQLNAPKIQAFQQQLAEMLKRIPSLKLG